MKSNGIGNDIGRKPVQKSADELDGVIKKEIEARKGAGKEEALIAEAKPRSDKEGALRAGEYQRSSLLKQGQQSSGSLRGAQKSVEQSPSSAQKTQDTTNYAKTQSKNLYVIKGLDQGGKTVEAVTDDYSAYQRYSKNNKPLSQQDFQRLSQSDNVVTSARSGGNLNVEAPKGHVKFTASPNDTLNSALNVKTNAGTKLNVSASKTNLNVGVQGTAGRDVVRVDTQGKADIRTFGGNDKISVKGTSDARVDAGDGINTVDASRNNNVAITGGNGMNTVAAYSNLNATINTNGPVNKVNVGRNKNVDINLRHNVEAIIGAQGNAAASIKSGPGKATINATKNRKLSITSGKRNDVIVANSNKEVNIDAGDGRNVIQASSNRRANIRSGQHSDIINTYGTRETNVKSGAGDDYIRTGQGHDRINAGDGRDVVYSGAGDDEVLGGRGDDYIDGGAGDDHIKGGQGRDILSGNAGDDRIIGGKDDDVLIAGPGNDQLQGDEGQDVAYHQKGDIVAKGTEQKVASDISDSFDPAKDLKRIKVTGSWDFRNRVRDDLVTLRSIPVSAKGLEHIENARSGNGSQNLNITIKEISEDGGYARSKSSYVPWRYGSDALLRKRDHDGDGVPDAGKGTHSEVDYNPGYRHQYKPIHSRKAYELTQPISILYHELGHGYSYITGTLDFSQYTGTDTVDSATEGRRRRKRRVYNEERKIVGVGIQDGNRTKHNHPSVLTENEFLKALNRPLRKRYRIR